MTDRRAFLKPLAAGAVLGTCRLPGPLQAQTRDDPWRQLPAILARIRPPAFAARDFEVTAFGAVGDNSRDNTEAFCGAIAACVRAGGGRMPVPKGELNPWACALSRAQSRCSGNVEPNHPSPLMDRERTAQLHITFASPLT